MKIIITREEFYKLKAELDSQGLDGIEITVCAPTACEQEPCCQTIPQLSEAEQLRREAEELYKDFE